MDVDGQNQTKIYNQIFFLEMSNSALHTIVRGLRFVVKHVNASECRQNVFLWTGGQLLRREYLAAQQEKSLNLF